MRQKNEVDQCNEDELLDQGPFERIGRPIDQFGAVIEGNQSNTFGQPRLYFLDLFLDGFDRFESAYTVAHDDNAADGFLAVFIQRTGSKGITDAHLSHVADKDRRAVARTDNDVFDICRRFDEPKPADDGPFAGLFDHIPADIVIGSFDSFDHRRQRHVHGPQAVRIDVYLILLNVAANGRDLGDPGRGIELVAHKPVLQRPQVAQVHRVRFERVPIDLAESGSVGAERRGYSFGELPRDQVEPFENSRPGPVEFHVVFKDHVDHRKTERGTRTDGPDTWQSLKVCDQGIRDLILDLFRRAAGPVGKYDHLVVRYVRYRIYRRTGQRPIPRDRDRNIECENDNAVGDRPVDEPVDHRRLLCGYRQVRAALARGTFISDLRLPLPRHFEIYAA